MADGPSTAVSLPPGYSLESGAAPSGLPEGYTAEPSTSGQAAEKPEGDYLSKAEDVIQSIPAGFGKGVESTVAGVSSLLHKIPVVGETLAPEVGVKAMQEQSTPHGLGEMIGYGGETLTEFLLGDEALKGLSLADKLSHASKVASIFEKSPRLMKAIQTGADLSKASTELGAKELQAIKESPVLSRLVSAGMDAIRQGTVQAAQTGVKSGGDVKKAAEEGVGMAGVSAVLGGGAGVIGGLAEKAGKLGKTLEVAKKGTEEAKTVAIGAEKVPQAAEKAAKPLIEAPATGNVPTHEEIVSGAAKATDSVEQTMHKTFDDGIKQISSDLAGKTIPLDGSPLAQAAKEAKDALSHEPKGLTERLGKSLQGMIPGTERGEKMVGTILGEAKKEDAVPSWLLGEEVKGGAEAGKEVKPENLSVDNLIEYRQRLNKLLPQMAYDDPNKKVIYKLIGGVDDSIQKMADESGNPEISDSYKNLRAQYKDQVQFFNSASAKAGENPIRYQVAQKLQSGTLNNAPQYLLSGNNSLAKIRAAKDLLGPESMDNLAVQTIRRWANDAMNTETGQLNAKKLVDQWNKIPDDARNEFFSQANTQYRKMIEDLSENPEVNKNTLNRMNILIRFGVFPAAGALVGRETQQRTGIPRAEMWGALAGMLYGGGRKEMANDMVKFMAENPGYLKAIGTAGEAAKPVAKKVGTAVKQQAAQSLMGRPSLADVYGGAAQPLGEQ